MKQDNAKPASHNMHGARVGMIASGAIRLVSTLMQILRTMLWTARFFPGMTRQNRVHQEAIFNVAALPRQSLVTNPYRAQATRPNILPKVIIQRVQDE